MSFPPTFGPRGEPYAPPPSYAPSPTKADIPTQMPYGLIAAALLAVVILGLIGWSIAAALREPGQRGRQYLERVHPGPR